MRIMIVHESMQAGAGHLRKYRHFGSAATALVPWV
eukprot:SAG11_NODE_28105_length_325_cov_0.982301_1_plen_34_part_01